MEGNSSTNSTTTSASSSYIMRQGVTHRIGIAVGLLGVVLNLASLVVFVRAPSLLNKIPGMIIRHQCAVDLLAGLVLVYAQYHSSLLGTRIPDAVPDKELYCWFVWSTGLVWAIMQVSTSSLHVLTVERYVSVCHPLKHGRIFSRRGVIAILVCVWIGGLTYVGGFFPHMMSYDARTNACLPAPEPAIGAAYGLTLIVLDYVLYIPLASIGYARMLKVLRSRISTLVASQDKAREKRARSFILTCASLSVAYVLCYSCNIFYSFLAAVGVIQIVPESVFYQFSVVALYCNCFINPIVFAVKMRAFRAEVILLLTFGRVRLQTEGGSTSGTAETEPVGNQVAMVGVGNFN